MTSEQCERFREFKAMFPNAKTAPDVMAELRAARIVELDMASWICIEGSNEIGSVVWLVDEDGGVVTTATGLPNRAGT